MKVAYLLGRISPPFLSANERIVATFFFWLIFRIIRFRQASGHFQPLSDIALNATFLFNLFPGRQEGIVWASWTIGVEILFYIAFPFIFRAYRTLKAATLIFITFIALAFLSRELPAQCTNRLKHRTT